MQKMAIAQDNIDRMNSLTQDLQQALMQIGSAVYAHAGASSGASPGQSNDDVIDADFVE